MGIAEARARVLATARRYLRSMMDRVLAVKDTSTILEMRAQRDLRSSLKSTHSDYILSGTVWKTGTVPAYKDTQLVGACSRHSKAPPRSPTETAIAHTPAKKHQIPARAPEHTTLAGYSSELPGGELFV